MSIKEFLRECNNLSKVSKIFKGKGYTKKQVYTHFATICGWSQVTPGTLQEPAVYRDVVKDCRPGDVFLIHNKPCELVCYLKYGKEFRRAVIKPLTSETEMTVALGIRNINLSSKINKEKVSELLAQHLSEMLTKKQIESDLQKIKADLSEKYPEAEFSLNYSVK